MSAGAPGDPYVAERIRSAIAHDPRVNELGITVVLVGSRAFVSGVVPTPERRDAIASVMAEQFAELELHNEVTVQQVGAMPVRESLG